MHPPPNTHTTHTHTHHLSISWTISFSVLSSHATTYRETCLHAHIHFVQKTEQTSPFTPTIICVSFWAHINRLSPRPSKWKSSRCSTYLAPFSQRTSVSLTWLLCYSFCIYLLSSKEAIKIPGSIGVRRQEFLYKHQNDHSHQDSSEAHFK